MNDRPFLDLATGTCRTLTFVIESGLSNFHPGILHIEERLPSGSYRSLHHSFLCLYEPEVASDLGQIIAGAIYDDLLTPRQGRYKGPRFDFQSDIHLMQKTDGTANKPSRGGSALHTTTPLGIASIHGGLSRGEICSTIARTFYDSWQRLADEAYIHPSQVLSETGEVLYDHSGCRFTWVVRFESNFRLVTGPVVFLAYQGEQITEFATLHQGCGQDGNIDNHYRRYAFLYTRSGTWLIEKGAFTLNSPIQLPKYDIWEGWTGDTQGREDRGSFANVLVKYWYLPKEGIHVSGGMPYDSYDWPSRYWYDELERQLQTAHPNGSIYCSVCGRDYRPDITYRELEVFSSCKDGIRLSRHLE